MTVKPGRHNLMLLVIVIVGVFHRNAETNVSTTKSGRLRKLKAASGVLTDCLHHRIL